MDGMEEVLREFLVESYENLEQVDLDLLALEEDPQNRATLDCVFRTIHTIKGTCGFLDFHRLEAVAHAGENLLDLLREGQLTLDAEIAGGLLEMVDAVRAILGCIERSGEEGEQEYAELIARLHALRERGQSPTGAAPSEAAVEPGAQDSCAAEPECAARETEPAAASCSAPAAQEAAAPASPATPAIERPPGAESACAPPSSAPAAEERAAGSSVADSTIRVEVSLLDMLMNLVGELVLARNQILQFTTENEESGLLATSQRLNLVTTELQEMFMKTRMQPISTIWNKFPRVVRDLSRQCGKQVRVEMEGKDTECDKTLIEAIKDPLTHIIRNSVDHGIESPEERQAAGKNPEGVLQLRAFHEGGSVHIEIQDDGAGLPLDRIKKKAIERGLISEEEAEAMDDRIAASLIFRPGFSTAERVSNVSGRGVGMDVVKTNIERIGGKVELQSAPGLGTTLRVKIPLTLAIIPALTVTSGRESFAIPQISLVELVRVEAREVRESIECIHGAPVYRLRGKLLPIVYLNEQLELPPQECEEPQAMNIVVLQAESKTFGLVVDEVNDTQEIVVKPVGRHLKGISVFAGATIMGDGSVALILDVMGLAQRARVISEVRDHVGVDQLAATDRHGTGISEESQTLLLFQSSDDGRMAVPISKIARLEEFEREVVERAGDQRVVQYRDEILPLVRLDEILPERRSRPRAEVEPSATVHVLVYRHQGRSIGLVVDRILDIIDVSLTVRGEASRDGVLCTAVIHDRVTELLDLEAVVRCVEPRLGAEPDGVQEDVMELVV